MEFYHNLITEKSFNFLKKLRKKYRFILIGGWAVFFYSHSLKSKDIDIILDYEELGKLKENFAISKNERLKKYEIKIEGIDVDIYLPHYSDLGVDIEEIKKKAVEREGFILPTIEMLLMLKLYAWHNRRGAVKGQKDELDIFSLLFLPEFDWQKYLKTVKKSKFENYHRFLIELIKRTGEMKELGINKHQMSKMKKKFNL